MNWKNIRNNGVKNNFFLKHPDFQYLAHCATRRVECKHFGVVKKAYFQLQLNHIVTRRKSNKVTANYSLSDIMNSNSLSAVNILICE